MVRDLVETGIAMVRAEHQERVRARARASAEAALADLLLKQEGKPPNGIEREDVLRRLRAGELDDTLVEVQIPDRRTPTIEVMNPRGGDQMGVSLGDMFGSMMPKRQKTAKLKAAEALRALHEQEAEKLVDEDAIVREALKRTQEHGIIFLDEVDKIAGKDSSRGPDVSREGVQRDLLPIVEGSNVSTKHGVVKTDHMLFIAAGAFHVSKPSDLIPELQGRFPIRVELQSLSESDFERILTEPKNSLVSQYVALLGTEEVTVEVREDAVSELARVAHVVNQRLENIGARRLHTILERVFEELSFHAPEMHGATIEITAPYVQERLSDVVEDVDLSRYILVTNGASALDL